jgi:hypothetical protein
MWKRICMLALVALWAAVGWTGESRAAEGVDERSIWTPSEAVGKSLFSACAVDDPECLPEAMAAAGASPEAATFARKLQGEGYMESFTEHGRVDLVSAFFPYYANSNWRLFLVNGTPELLDLNDWDRLQSIDLEQSEAFRTLAERHSEAALWPDARFVEAAMLADQGQRFVFDYPIVDGCHACELLGYARLAYGFDAAGKLTTVELVGIEPP